MVDPFDLATRAASFAKRADRYAAVRPSYPDDAVAWLLPGSPQQILDLAAGTGKLTQALVRHYAAANAPTIIAVEPAEPMLAQLTKLLPEVSALVGTAEHIPLPDNTVDAVVCGQAWHWFNEAAAGIEIARVLRPGGTVGVVWNDRDDTVDWVRQFDQIIHRGDILEPKTKHVAPKFGAQFSTVEHAVFRWLDTIPVTDLRPLAASRSYLLMLPNAERDRILADIDQLIATHPDLTGRDHITLPYITNAYRVRRK